MFGEHGCTKKNHTRSLSSRKSILHGRNIMYANIPRKPMLEHERFHPPHPTIDYFDNVMTKFIVNNKTDALKTDVNLFFTTNCQTVRSRWLTRRISYKNMRLSAY